MFIWYELRKKYLFYDAVHLVKNIRNNLLTYGRFIFSSFKFDGFKDPINVPGREIKWTYFYDVQKKDVITQFDLPPLTAAECILCNFSSDNFQQYTCSLHQSIGECFCNRAVANVFFNNKRKLSTDSAIADGIKVIKKDREKSKLESFITLNFYFLS